MKKIFTLLSLTLVLNVMVQKSPAQDSTTVIKWSGDLRLRSEADARDFNLTTPPNLFTLLRFRYGVMVSLPQNVSLFGQFQDSRTFGQEGGPGAFNTIFNMANVDIHQAYVKADKFITDEFSFRLGRMEVAYGNERIIGSVAWNNIGRSFDGIVFRYALPAGFIDAFAFNPWETSGVPATVNAAGVRYLRDTGMVVTGGYYSNKFSDVFSTDAYAVYQVSTRTAKPDTLDLARTTLGTLLKVKSGSLFGDAELSYQLGSKSGVDVGAYMIALTAGYEIGSSWLSIVDLHADVLSGSSDAEKEIKTYDPLYPTAHKFYGSLDYFTNFASTAIQPFNRGIVDAYLRIVSRPSGNFTLITALHHFATQYSYSWIDIASGQKQTSVALGHELNFIAQYKYSKNLLFESGLGGFTPGAALRSSFGAADVGIYAYLTTQVSF